MSLNRRAFTSVSGALLIAVSSPSAWAKKKAHHKDGRSLLGDKVKQNGSHKVDKNGLVTASVDVQDGKVAGMHAKHDKKGELAIKKYKTSKKLAQASGFIQTSYMKVQDQYLGTTYIGYSYIDDYGDEVVYWYPYDMILNGDTGAVEYVPA